jgi:endonuclease
MASTRKAHLVLIPRDDGSVAMHAMKEWLRQNPSHIPAGLDGTNSTSQQLRAGLLRNDWTLQETPMEFRLMPPGVVAEPSSVLRDILDESPPIDPEGNEDSSSFGLEYQLRDFLAVNLSNIPVNGQRLQVFVDPTGRDGVEFPTAVGPIDLLAIDAQGSFYVFELKRGRTPDHTLGQLTRYMGWVSHTIGKGRKVIGVVVAKQVSDALRYSISVVPNISLFEYEVSFRLNPASTIIAASS